MPAAYQLTTGTSVLRVSDGAVIPDAPGNRDWQAYQAWLHEGHVADPSPAVSATAYIDVSTFMARFTTTEQTAIFARCQSDPIALQWLAQALARPSIDLLHPLTKQGTDYWVSLGLLTADREAEVLTP